jgi:hypothetical protein
MANIQKWAGYLLILLSINLIFILPILFSGDHYHLTLHPNNTDGHRMLYFLPANEFSHSMSVSKDICIYEQANAPFPRMHASYGFYGFINKIIGNPVYTYLIGNIIFSAIILLLVHLFLKQEFRKRDYSIIFLALFFMNSLPSGLKNYLTGFISFLKTFDLASFGSIGIPLTLSITRILLYLHFILFAYVFLNKRISGKLRIFLLSFLLGICIYFHMYPALLLYASFGLMCIFYFIKKNRKWKEIAQIFAFSLVITIPFFINALNAKNSTNGAELALRYDIFTTPSLFIPPLLITLLFIFGIFVLLKSKRTNEFKLLFVSILVSVFLTSNLHIITRYLPAPNNINNFAYIFLFPLIAVVLLNDFVFTDMKIYRKFSGILSVCLVVLLFLSYFCVGLSLIQTSGIDKSFSEVIDWTRENTNSSDVLLADYGLQDEFLAWTSVNLYFCNEFYTALPSREISRRVIEGYRLLGKNNRFIDQKLGEVIYTSVSETNFVSRFLDEPFISYPEQDFKDVIKNIESIKKEELSDVDSKISYKLDYILVRKGEDFISGPISYTIVYENDKYMMVKLTKN